MFPVTPRAPLGPKCQKGEEGGGREKGVLSLFCFSFQGDRGPAGPQGPKGYTDISSPPVSVCICVVLPETPFDAHLLQRGTDTRDQCFIALTRMLNWSRRCVCVHVHCKLIKNFSLRIRVRCRIGIGGVKSKETRHIMDWYQNTTRWSYIQPRSMHFEFLLTKCRSLYQSIMCLVSLLLHHQSQSYIPLYFSMRNWIDINHIYCMYSRS